jgi:hypothetical protein
METARSAALRTSSNRWLDLIEPRSSCPRLESGEPEGAKATLARASPIVQSTKSICAIAFVWISSRRVEQFHCGLRKITPDVWCADIYEPELISILRLWIAGDAVGPIVVINRPRKKNKLSLRGASFAEESLFFLNSSQEGFLTSFGMTKQVNLSATSRARAFSMQ